MITPYQTEQKIGKAMEVTGVVASTGSSIGGFIAQHHETIWAIGVLAGVVVGVAGLIITLIYKQKQDVREQEIHALRVQEMKNDILFAHTRRESRL